MCRVLARNSNVEDGGFVLQYKGSCPWVHDFFPVQGWGLCNKRKLISDRLKELPHDMRWRRLFTDKPIEKHTRNGLDQTPGDGHQVRGGRAKDLRYLGCGTRGTQVRTQSERPGAVYTP